MKLTYCTNFNGWILPEANYKLEAELVQFSLDLCDEYGEFEWGRFSIGQIEEITKIVHKYYPDVDVEIEYDRYSS